jgi:UrcA family protein
MTTRLIDSSFATRRLLPAALVAGALALGLPTVAQSAEPAVVKVKYSQSAIKHEAGARALYAKLQAAAQRACGEADGRDLRMVRAVSDCQEQAVASAVATIASPMLAAVHTQESGGTRFASAGDTRTSR